MNSFPYAVSTNSAFNFLCSDFCFKVRGGDASGDVFQRFLVMESLCIVVELAVE